MKIFRNYAALIYLCTLSLGVQASLPDATRALQDWSADDIRQVLLVYNIPLPEDNSHPGLLDTAHSHWESIVSQSQLTADQILANLDQFKTSVKAKAQEKWSNIKHKAHKHAGVVQDVGGEYAAQGYGIAKEKAAQGADIAKEKAAQGYDIAAEKAAQGYDIAKEKAAEGADIAKEKAAQGYEVGKDYAAQGADIAKEKAAQGYDIAKEKAAEGYQAASAYAAEKAAQGYDIAKEKAAEGADIAKEKAAQGYEVGKDYAAQGYDIAAEKAAQGYDIAKEKAAEGADIAKEKAAEGYEVGKDYAAQGYDIAKEKAAHGYDIAKEKAAEGIEIAKEKAAEGLDVAKGQAATGFNAVKGKVAQGFEAIKEQAAQGYHDAQVKSDNTAKNVADAAKNAAKNVGEAANNAADAAKDTYGEAKAEAPGLLSKLRQGVQHVFSAEREDDSGDIASWVFAWWSDSQLKNFLRKHDIAFSQEEPATNLRRIARDNYNAIKDKFTPSKSSSSLSDWLYESWSDADLKSWLESHDVTFPDTANRRELISSVRRTSENLSDKLARFKQSLFSSFENDKEDLFEKTGELKDSVFDSWSTAKLKSFIRAHGIRLTEGASDKRDELLALARKHKEELSDDVADFIAKSRKHASPIVDKFAESPRRAFENTAKLWSESRLRSFLISRGIRVPESANREEIMQAANDNFEALQNKAWSFGSWSTDSLKRWLQDVGQDLSDDRQELINKAQNYIDNARNTVNRAGSKVSDAGAKVMDAGTNVKDIINDFYQSSKDSMNAWSDKDLKEYLTSYGVISPAEWTREDLLRAANQQQIYFSNGFNPEDTAEDATSTCGYLGRLLNYFKNNQDTPTPYGNQDEL